MTAPEDVAAVAHFISRVTTMPVSTVFTNVPTADARAVARELERPYKVEQHYGELYPAVEEQASTIIQLIDEKQQQAARIADLEGELKEQTVLTAAFRIPATVVRRVAKALCDLRFSNSHGGHAEGHERPCPECSTEALRLVEEAPV